MNPCEITLSFTDICFSCFSREIFNVANMSLKAIRENKIHAKNCEFTVVLLSTFNESNEF